MNKKNPYQFLIMVAAILLVGVSSCTRDDALESPPALNGGGTPLKIISLSGVITEVLYRLGQGEHIVGIDITSTYPADSLKDKVQLGHTTQLNTEAILALQPDIIFCLAIDTSKTTIQQLAASGVSVIPLSTSNNLHNSLALAQQLSQHLHLNSQIQQKLEQQVHADSLALTTFLAPLQTRPRVLFIYARGTSRLFVSGTDTPVAAMIAKAGGQNAITGFSDYKELTSESLIATDPEVILMFSSGLASLDGIDGLRQIPGLDQTQAYLSKRIIAMDGHYLSSFGPRCGAAALELAQAIHQTSQ